MIDPHSVASASKHLDSCRSKEYGGDVTEVTKTLSQLLDDELAADAIDCARYLLKIRSASGEDEDSFAVMYTRVNLGRALLEFGRAIEAYDECSQDFLQ